MPACRSTPTAWPDQMQGRIRWAGRRRGSHRSISETTESLNVRKALVLVGLAGLLMLTACGKQADDSAAAQSPTTAAGGGPGGGGPADDLVLGPQGLGAIKLGGTEESGVLAGLSWANVAGYTDRACPKVATIPRSGFPVVHLSSKRAIVVIGAAGDIHTPQGIKVGSTRAEVRKAYPTLKNETADPNNLGVNLVAVSGNPAAQYRIRIDTPGTVGGLDLMLTNNGCVLV
jgi:hypothetical protein